MEAARFGRIRLRHLQTFLAVARLGNLRRAADSLAVTQPAVTKTVNELEEILDVRLFERGRRGAVLTAAAELFLRHASASVGELELAVGSVAPDRGASLLRLGVLPTVTSSFVPQALLEFRRADPDTRVRIVSGSNPELLLLLQQRELDVVVGRLSEPATMTGLTFEHLYSDALVVAVRPTHPRLARGRRPIVDWKGFDAILPTTGTVIRHAAESLMSTHGMQPNAGYFETLSTSLGRALTLGSDALWFVPLDAVQADLDAGVLARLPMPVGATEEPVGLLLAADTASSGPLTGLVRALRSRSVARRASVGPAPAEPSTAAAPADRVCD
jgi:LysR family pca operon transcriptional activator